MAIIRRPKDVIELRRITKTTLIIIMAAAGLCLAMEPFDPLTSRLVAFCGLMAGLMLVPFTTEPVEPVEGSLLLRRKVLPLTRGAQDAPKRGESFIRL